MSEATVNQASVEEEDEKPYIHHIVKIHMANDKHNYVGYTIPGQTKSYETDIPIAYIKDFKRMFNEDKFIYVTIDTRTLGNRKKTVKYQEITEKIPENFKDLDHNVKNKISEINKFSELKEKWDGYNAKKISRELCDDAIVFIKLVASFINQLGLKKVLPEVVPVPNGNIQFEWAIENNYLEIELSGKYEILRIRNEGLDNQFDIEFNVDKKLETLDSVLWILG